MSSREAGASATAPGGVAAPGAAEVSLPPGHPPIGARPAAAPLRAAQPASAGSITGRIVLSAQLKGQVSPSDVLYIMAKKGGATLAVRREANVRLPFAFEISGGHAMMAGTGFEGPLDVVARLSKTGDAIPSTGDLEGVARSVPVPARGITVTIDRVRE
jgi:cytochrome c-type biogenesis protein CcmH